MTAIAVYCASITRIDPAYVDLATAVGTAIGERGHTLITGGGSVAMTRTAAELPNRTDSLVSSRNSLAVPSVITPW